MAVRPLEPGSRSEVKQRKRPAADVEVIRAGSRYVWGRGRDFYGIWDQKHPDEPVATFDGASRADGWRYFQELEWEAKPIKRRHQVGRWIRRFLLAILVVVAIALLGLVGYLLYRNRSIEGSLWDRIAADSAAVDAADAAAGPPVFVRHENAEGAFAFRHPANWTVVDRSTGTELSSTSEGLSISFEVTSDPRIGVAAESMARSVTGGWTGVELEPRQRRAVGAFEAVSVSGVGTDGAGRGVRFLVIALDGGTRNFTIRVLVSRDYDAAAVLPGVEEVVASFEPF
ncbi:MAG: hypothetical protein ACXWZF_10620 [Actinomycetota bacterium]